VGTSQDVRWHVPCPGHRLAYRWVVGEDSEWAERIAHDLLADSLPRRWAHTKGVASQVRTLAGILGEDAGRGGRHLSSPGTARPGQLGYVPDCALALRTTGTPGPDPVELAVAAQRWAGPDYLGASHPVPGQLGDLVEAEFHAKPRRRSPRTLWAQTP
jgi:hypothetical protein